MSAVLAPPVRVEDETFVRAASEPRHVECIRHQAALHVGLHAPAHHLTAEQVNDGGQIHPALVGSDVGDVTRPDLIRCGPGEVALQQVRRYWQLMFAVRGDDKLAFASGPDTVLLHEAAYRMADGTVLMDVQQLIPLPEAIDFQTQIGVKKQAERQNRTERHDLRLKFWEGLLEQAKTKTDIHSNRKPTQDGWLSGGIGRTSFSLTYSTRKNDSQVELWISFGSGQAMKSKAAFKALEAQKNGIEADFGAPLEWQELPEGDGCRIRYVVPGGYKSPQDQWPTIHASLTNAMIRLDKAMRSRVTALTL
jgi:hypothetical protein